MNRLKTIIAAPSVVTMLSKLDRSELVRNNQPRHHESMNGTKYVTIHYEHARHSGYEDYSEGVTRRQYYANVEVGLYRKAMGLRQVFITHKNSNSISFVYMNHRPWIQRRSVRYAVVEP